MRVRQHQVRFNYKIVPKISNALKLVAIITSLSAINSTKIILSLVPPPESRANNGKM